MNTDTHQNFNIKKILLVGNPNVGKSTLFNALCNRKQKTGNYAGVTVSSLVGEYLYKEERIQVTDLPGTYSLYASSEDEAVSTQHILDFKESDTGLLFIVEALSIKRGLLLFQQIQDLGLPTLLVINQIDEAEKRGVLIDFESLEQQLGVKVIKTNAKTGEGITELKDAISAGTFTRSTAPHFKIPVEHRPNLPSAEYKDWMRYVMEGNAGAKSKRLQVQEAVRRYAKIDTLLEHSLRKKIGAKERLTERLDQLLVHKVFGYFIFAGLLLLIFQAVFFLAEYPMGWIEAAFDLLADEISHLMPEGPLNALITGGILPGIAGIVVFAPQIFILFFLLYVMEDSGYMARVVYLMDRLLQPFGLNGKSIVPLVSGMACAVPAIMSARNIENVKERLITILVTPFMACSARLPIYSIVIAMIIPEGHFLWISYKALMLFLMYFLGFAMSLISALVLKKMIKAEDKSYLVMDLPTYKMPLWWVDVKLGLGKAWDFISGAGKVIFAVSILLWVLSYLGPKQKPHQLVATDVPLEQSYLAQVGGVIQPAVKPLGYDWKMGIGVLTSFAARETFVGTIAILYGLDEDTDVESEAGERTLIQKMQADVTPTGGKVFSLATGLSILMFYAFSMQCISTIATVYKETKSWRWTLTQLIGMTGFAYITAFLVYQMFK